MDLFISIHPNGIRIGRGKAPEGSIAVFLGMGKHLPKVLHLMPPPVSDGIYAVSPCLALTAIGHCVKPADPEDHIAGFLECLYPVDKLNAIHPECVCLFAKDIFGDDYFSMLQKAGVHYMKKDRYDHAFKMVRSGKSYWFRIDTEKSRNFRRLVNRERSRSPRRQGLQDTPSVGSGASEATE